MTIFKSEYIAAGGNRHPAAADWNVSTGLVAYGTGRNIALWKPLVVNMSKSATENAYSWNRTTNMKAYMHY